MRPVPIALWLMLEDVWYGCFQSEPLMRSEAVVVYPPVGPFAVECMGIGEQQSFMIVDERFLEGAMEVFTHGVHFRGLGIGSHVHDVAVLEPGIKYPLAFTAAVGAMTGSMWNGVSLKHFSKNCLAA